MDLQTALTLIVSVVVIFSCVIIFTRIFGLRTFAKMSSFDFASTIAIGSVLASVILNKDHSLLEGGLVLLAIIGFQTLFSYTVRKLEWFKKLSTNQPKMLMWEGEVLYDNLKDCNVGIGDLMAKLREANVHQFSEVQAVILESTGDVSVLHSDKGLEIDPKILDDVQM